MLSAAIAQETVRQPAAPVSSVSTQGLILQARDGALRLLAPSPPILLHSLAAWLARHPAIPRPPEKHDPAQPPCSSLPPDAELSQSLAQQFPAVSLALNPYFYAGCLTPQTRKLVQIRRSRPPALRGTKAARYERGPSPPSKSRA